MRRVITLVIGVGLLVGTLGGPANAAGVQATISVGGQCVAATTSDPFADEIRLKDKDGVLKDTAAMFPDVTSHGCFPDERIQPTDRVVIRGEGETLATITVPRISASTNRSTDVVSGSAPAGAVVDIETQPCNAVDDCGNGITESVTANGAGAWSKNLQAQVDLRGSDLVQASIVIGDDRFVVVSRVPFVEVTLGKAVVKGGARSGATATARLLRDGSERARVTTGADLLGAFSGKLRKNGSDVVVAQGDRVKVDLVPAVTIKVEITLVVLKRFDRITGHCAPGTRYGVVLRFPDGSVSGTKTGTPDPDGDLMVDSFELGGATGWTVTLVCRSPGGDRVRRTVTIP